MSDPTGIAVFGYSHGQRMFDSSEETQSRMFITDNVCKTETLTDFFKPKLVC